MYHSLVAKAQEAGPAGALEAVMYDTGYMAEIEAERTIEALGRAENLRELQSGVDEYLRAMEGSLVDGSEWEELDGMEQLAQYLATVSLTADTDSLETNGGAVTLMTLHNAKGLEYKAVFLIGLEEGVFPHMRSLGDPSELEEERPSRVRRYHQRDGQTVPSACFSRTLFGSMNWNAPSRFLSEIPSALMMGCG